MSTSAQTNWDDLRFVLAVADEGSVASAGRTLGVNHATVLRRIAAFETRHGLKVFEKTPTGYRVSADRRSLIEALREAGEAFGQVERLIEAERPNLSSSIRITSTDAFCHFILGPIISGLPREISSNISILSSNIHLDFDRLQADITVRPARKLPDELSGIHAANFRFGIFSTGDCDGSWLGLEGAIARSSAGEWMRSKAHGARAPVSSDSFIMLASLAAEGRGRAILPMFVGNAWPQLELIEIPEDVPALPIWVASHVDLLDSGRLRRARSYLAERLSEVEPTLMG
ncbi:LysR family transcriptional regulator [Silicimonas sp. MF1-12-2]|uniref:LysR family transcriptional regulator n=1 Tax=Silicimonas sp. MF1-12-2 TaxID=3384793 RepID=UPI0039B52C7B